MSYVQNKAAYLNLSALDLPEMRTMQEFMGVKFFSMQDEVLHKVVCMCLGREIYTTEELQTRFQIIHYEGKGGREFIAFDGNDIGELKIRSHDDGGQRKMVYEFVPHVTAKHLD